MMEREEKPYLLSTWQKKKKAHLSEYSYGIS